MRLAIHMVKKNPNGREADQLVICKHDWEVEPGSERDLNPQPDHTTRLPHLILWLYLKYQRYRKLRYQGIGSFFFRLEHSVLAA